MPYQAIYLLARPTVSQHFELHDSFDKQSAAAQEYLTVIMQKFDSFSKPPVSRADSLHVFVIINTVCWKEWSRFQLNFLSWKSTADLI